MNNKEKVVFVGLDASKATLAVSVADDGRDGEIRDWGTISTAPISVEKFLKKLAARFDRVEICYEAGPTGYGLYRQITAFGFTCYVIAPSLIPMRPGERIKTDRRDAKSLLIEWNDRSAAQHVGFEPKLPHATRRIDGSNAQVVTFAKLSG